VQVISSYTCILLLFIFTDFFFISSCSPHLLHFTFRNESISQFFRWFIVLSSFQSRHSFLFVAMRSRILLLKNEGNSSWVKSSCRNKDNVDEDDRRITEEKNNKKVSERDRDKIRKSLKMEICFVMDISHFFLFLFFIAKVRQSQKNVFL
jgi:hypothetical protein